MTEYRNLSTSQTSTHYPPKFTSAPYLLPTKSLSIDKEKVGRW